MQALKLQHKKNNMATLTTRVTESIVLNGQSYNCSHAKSIDNITQIIKSQFSVTTIGTSSDLATIISFGDSGSGYTTIDRDQLRYLRITNLDTTNFITLGLEDSSGNNAYYVKIDAGRSYIFGVPDDNNDADFDHIGFFADDAGHSYEEASESFVNATHISASSDTAACDIEIFIALDATSD